MLSQQFDSQAKRLIDDLKSVCANYGLGNDGNEFKIITQIFLYKFLNDRFAYEVNLGFKRGERWIFRHLDFELKPGDFLALVGPSGVGKPLIWSHSIWMLEYNIRSASIIGYVGAGGLGLQLHAYQDFHHWDRFATVLCCILIVVTLLDLLSERIRQRIARRLPSDFAHAD